jgi:hypothetical protein
MIVGLDGIQLVGGECGDEVDEGIEGRAVFSQIDGEIYARTTT